jgi:hypothetical protein
MKVISLFEDYSISCHSISNKNCFGEKVDGVEVG